MGLEPIQGNTITIQLLFTYVPSHYEAVCSDQPIYLL